MSKFLLPGGRQTLPLYKQSEETRASHVKSPKTKSCRIDLPSPDPLLPQCEQFFPGIYNEFPPIISGSRWGLLPKLSKPHRHH